MRKFVVILTILGLLGCATNLLLRVSNENRQKLHKLYVGMSEEDALRTMGTETVSSNLMSVNNPFRIQKMSFGHRNLQVIYYVTEVAMDDNVVDDNELTPLVFEDKELIGWGWEYLNNIK